jgi:hypothetical protein
LNRAGLLADALERLTLVSVPPDLTWEAVTVDNGSTDGTSSVIRRFGERLPVRSVLEPRPGIAHARNAAVRAARGTYVLWLDDDVLVSPMWLSAYHEASRAFPAADVFGGPIVPWYEGWGTTPPPWLAAARRVVPTLVGAYSALDLGPTPRPLAPEEYLWNANLMVRASAHRHAPYDTAFGRRPGSRIGGEEVVLLDRLRASGAIARWVPSAWVHHVIPVARQSIAYLQSHCEGWGEQKALVDRRQAGRGLSRRQRLWLRLLRVRHELRFQALRWTSSPERWIRPMVASSHIRGRLRSDRRARREARHGLATSG